MKVSRKTLEDWCKSQAGKSGELLALEIYFGIGEKTDKISKKDLEIWTNRQINDLLEYGSFLWGSKREKNHCGENLSFFYQILRHFNLKRLRDI